MMQCSKPLKVTSTFIWRARVNLIKSVLFDVKGKGKFKLLRPKGSVASSGRKYVLSYKGIKFVLTDRHGLGLLSIPFYKPIVYWVISSIRGEVFVDIGSFEGGYVLFTHNNFKEIVAVEPSPENLDVLKENLRLNGIRNVKVVNKAVSSLRDKIRLYLAENPYNSSTVFKTDRYVEVETITLDELLEPYNTVDLVKIDVEGAELDVIRSGANQLHKVKNVVVEVRNQYEDEIDKIFASLGFRKCVLEDRGNEKNILYYKGE